MAEDARATLAQLSHQIQVHLGRRLLGLYLLGSLAAGGFHEGRSDLDLIAVLETAVTDGDDLEALRDLHERFVNDSPDWRDRIEVLYISRATLASFAGLPDGTVARVSPGEPMHLRELGRDISWLLDWHSVISEGETLLGPPPLTLGPPVDDERLREAVLSQLHQMRETVRDNDVAYVPVHQGYIVATVCRALYALETGERTSKTDAVAWLAERRPELADFLWQHYNAYRADVRGPHERLIAFVDEVVSDAPSERTQR